MKEALKEEAGFEMVGKRENSFLMMRAGEICTQKVKQKQPCIIIMIKPERSNSELRLGQSLEGQSLALQLRVRPRANCPSSMDAAIAQPHQWSE